MRSARWVFIFCLFLCTIPVWAQQAQPNTAPPPATKDPQAVSVVNQALNVAGGVSAIAATTDYTATGIVTYHWAQDVQGTVTVRGNGFIQLRLDASLPDGVHSDSINGGQITRKATNGGVQQLHAQPPLSPTRLVLPYVQLRPAVNSPGFSLTYKGLVDIDGHSAHDIQVVQVQRILPRTTDPNGRLRAFLTVDYFIDASTFQIVMMQDTVPKYAIRQLHYSDYRPLNGILVPFSISEQVEGNPTMLIQLNDIKFNSGLQDSDFQL